LIRKPGALRGLDRLDRAFDPVEKVALPVGFVDEGQSGPIEPEAGVFRHELVDRHPEKIGNPVDFPVAHRDFSTPAAAVSAPLALVVNAFFHVVPAHRGIIAVFRNFSGLSADFPNDLHSSGVFSLGIFRSVEKKDRRVIFHVLEIGALPEKSRDRSQSFCDLIL